MDREGPHLETVLRRIAETPGEFLAEPRIGRTGSVVTAAVAGDLCRLLGGSPRSAALAPIAAADRNAQSVCLLLCWLLAEESLRSLVPSPEAVLALLSDGAAELAAQTPARRFVEDAERREELARFALARLGCRPAGESRAQSEDRLTSLSAVERQRVLAAARAAERRAREIRAALARKAAEESADKWTRE